MTDTVTIWASKEDNGAMLCDACGVDELNQTLPVIFGMIPPFESVEAANTFSIEQFDEYTEDNPPFERAVGKCLTCGASNEEVA